MSFTHLYVKTGYSFLNSTIVIDQLIEEAKKLNFKSLAITDENVLHGVIPFYKACQKADIKPIIGLTMEVFVHSTEEKEKVVLLAKNNEGYKQLISLSSSFHLHDQKLSLEDLEKEGGDLIAILPVISSKLKEFLLSSLEEARDYILNWQKAFSKGNFYLGVSNHGEKEERDLDGHIKTFHQSYDIPLVALQDVRYLKEDDYLAYDCLLAMKDGRTWSKDTISPKVRQRYLKSKEEMQATFKHTWPEALENNARIAEQCNVKLNFHKAIMPTYPLEHHIDAFAHLKQLCLSGAKRKYGHISTEIKERLNYELTVIKRMDFSDYFLIVSDFVSFAKSKGILVGPGRGSSAGSIVAYVLDITDVDPIKHNLLFERFLNPERTSMPDIDIDFPDHRREEVIEYIRNKYGKDFVAQIITFGTFGPRSVLRELIKTIGIDYRDEQYIFSHIPSGANKSIKHYLMESPELLAYVKQSDSLKTLFSFAHKLEGLPRHSSVHAAGIVIADQALQNYTPLIKGARETTLTQYAMDELESIGLLKIDLLGLRNLSLIENIVQSIQISMKKKIDIENLPKNDRKTYKLLQKGQTNGIFQLESPGMKRVLRDLKPTRFNDLVAVNALYRPGPMEFIPTYVRRKHDLEKVSYPHKDLVKILEPTYGVLIYQEQIMEITHKIAGFTYGEADLLRRGITTKNQELIKEQEEKFIEGCLHKGYEIKVAKEIFSWILRFSNYGFPKSHATAYSKISYMLAYLKANYPANFFAELLSSVMNDKQRVNAYIQEAKSLGVNVLAPSINHSIGKYSVQRNNIQIGLLAIKGINFQASQEILRVRKEAKFKDLFDFCMRISTDLVSKTMIENLILVGAFDKLHNNRASLLASLDQAIEQGELFKEFTNQGSLFEFDLQFKSNYEDIKDFSQIHKLTKERELIGMYVSSHPLKAYRRSLDQNSYSTLEEVNQMNERSNIKSAAIVQEVKTIRTRRGETMAFLTVGDETREIEAVIFPREYRRYWQQLKEEEMVFIKGKINIRNKQKQIIIEKITPFIEEELLVEEESKGRVYIKVIKTLNKQALHKIRTLAKNFPGTTPVIIYSELESKSYKLSKQYRIDPNIQSIEQLKKIFGREHVIYKK